MNSENIKVVLRFVPNGESTIFALTYKEIMVLQMEEDIEYIDFVEHISEENNHKSISKVNIALKGEKVNAFLNVVNGKLDSGLKLKDITLLDGNGKEMMIHQMEDGYWIKRNENIDDTVEIK